MLYYSFAVHKWGCKAYLDRQLCGHGNVEIIFIIQSRLFPKNFHPLFNIVLGQDGLIYDDVGWWSGRNKGYDRIENIGIGLGDIVEVIGTNNQVAPYHGSPIGSSVIVVDGGRIL